MYVYYSFQQIFKSMVASMQKWLDSMPDFTKTYSDPTSNEASWMVFVILLSDDMSIIENLTIGTTKLSL